VKYHLVNTSEWKKNSDLGLNDRINISNDIESKSVNNFRDAIMTNKLQILPSYTTKFNFFEASVKRIANDELKKFIEHTKQPIFTCSRITKISAVLLFLESCHLLIGFRELGAVTGIPVALALWFGSGYCDPKNKK
ncbi:hypothetical protein ACFLYH_02645, partial [Candidatus Dependentiae bacterium]